MSRLMMSVSFVLGVAFIVACGPAHVAPNAPKHRDYTKGNYAKTQESGSAKTQVTGSLYSDAVGGYLQDTRAVHLGDIVTVNIVESADAAGQTSTNTASNSSMSIGVNSLVGILPALQKAFPGLNPASLVGFSSQSAFDGSGKTTRTGTLNGTIAVRVVEEMPNGDLYIEGTKVVMINNEEYHLYLSGIIRPADITQDNAVASTKIADAQIEYTGAGDLSLSNRKGWFSRFLDWVNPF